MTPIVSPAWSRLLNPAAPWPRVIQIGSPGPQLSQLSATICQTLASDHQGSFRCPVFALGQPAHCQKKNHRSPELPDPTELTNVVRHGRCIARSALLCVRIDGATSLYIYFYICIYIYIYIYISLEKHWRGDLSMDHMAARQTGAERSLTGVRSAR